jgi:hypothetical protein
MREVTYTVHRLGRGRWIATVKESGDPPRPLAVSYGPEPRKERRSRAKVRQDEIDAAATVVEASFLDMRIRDLQRREGSLVARGAASHSSLPAVSRTFAAEMLKHMRKGLAANFSEDFLQRWFASRREGTRQGRSGARIRPRIEHLTKVQPN